MRWWSRRQVLALGAVFVLTLPTAAGETGLRASPADAATRTPDTLLVKALQEVRSGRLDAALASINQLITLRPDFRLAHLIRGDLLAARARPLATLGDAPRAPAASLSDLREEARVRLLRYLDQPEEGHLPLQVLQIAPQHRYVLLADASRARLYVFENAGGAPRLVRDYYMTIGRNGIDKRVEGDKKTPVGVYTITRFIPSAQLIDFYGSGAFPLDYPNEWDRLQGRTGHGIWIHGTPSGTYSRPPRASDGCLVLANPDLTDLAQYIQVGHTPIVIAERTDWVDPLAWEMERQEVLARLEQWRSDWEARDAARFLRHYAPEQLRGGWGEAKRRNIENKAWIRVSLADLSLFLYPDQRLAVATFVQRYASDSLRSVTVKRLYWRMEEGGWRIALEHNLANTTQLAGNAR
ncbi:MAG: L,D-transpeptidase family protein [Thiobacillaceae bacterium]|nr:L,D-transpeptidase family protein [Thiobacillaceae bacterium]